LAQLGSQLLRSRNGEMAEFGFQYAKEIEDPKHGIIVDVSVLMLDVYIRETHESQLKFGSLLRWKRQCLRAYKIVIWFFLFPKNVIVNYNFVPPAVTEFLS
jgi:hypothetical protein